MANDEKYTTAERSFIGQFNDNPKCVRAYQLALQHLNIDDSLDGVLKRCIYVAAVASQGIDDDVYIAGMLHPLNEYDLGVELSSAMAGLGYEALKTVRVLQDNSIKSPLKMDIQRLYERTSNFQPKYNAVIMARVMYKLINIDRTPFNEASLIMDEAIHFTSKLEVPYDIRIQFDTILANAKRYYEETYETKIPASGILFTIIEPKEEEVSKVEDKAPVEGTPSPKVSVNMTKDTYEEEYISHVELAKKLGIKDKDSVELPGFGKVFYYATSGFCTAHGECIILNQQIDDTPTKDSPKDDAHLEAAEYMRHVEVANRFKVGHNKVIDLPGIGEVLFLNKLGFVDKSLNKISIDRYYESYVNGDFDSIVLAGKELDSSTQEPGKPVDADESDKEILDKHHALARLIGIKDNDTVTVVGHGVITYTLNDGFTDENGLLDLSCLESEV